MNLSTHLKAVAAIDPERWALEQDGRQVPWRAITDIASAIEKAVEDAGVPVEAGLFITIKNSLPSALALLGGLVAGRPIVYVNAMQPEEKRVAKLRNMLPAMLIGMEGDFSPATVAALSEAGGVAVVIKDDLTVSLVDGGRATVGAGPFYEPPPDTALVMMTSGTTGVPKRIWLSNELVLQGMREGARRRGGEPIMPDRVRRSPTMLFAPLFHASGTFGLLMSMFEARPAVIFEKFRIDTFRQALRRYPVKFVNMPPAVIRMVLESDLTRDDLKRLLAVRSGTAPLPPDVQEAFEERFGVPVLATYGATEFMGALARWTIEDYVKFRQSKRGSVGRVSPGVEMRVVDVDDGGEVKPGNSGLLEVRGGRVGSDKWLRTNDLARLDEDGFLWIMGRADDVIIRGGFKVMAGEVAAVLTRHERVREAAVIGVPDPRLGEVPMAAIEPPEGVEPPTPEELIDFARQHLVAYQVPARILVVPKLPRTVSLKISRPDVCALFAREVA